MNKIGLSLRRFLARHCEAICIFAFICTDCLCPGWVLGLGSLIAILWVCGPAAATVSRLPATEVSTFFKAFIKTRKAQCLAVLLFWLYAVRLLVEAATAAHLLENGASIPSMLISEALEFASMGFEFVATPFLIYGAACLVAICLRARLKATARDPDLIWQRQKWSGVTHFLFLSSFIAGILSITLNSSGPAYMVSNWLLASARDANVFGEDQITVSPIGTLEKPNEAAIVLGKPAPVAAYNPNARAEQIPIRPWSDTPAAASPADLVDPFAETATVPTAVLVDPFAEAATPPTVVIADRHATHAPVPATTPPGLPPVNSGNNYSWVYWFDGFVITALSSIAFLLLLQPVLKLNALLTSFCWRVVSPKSPQNVVEGFLEALRLPSRSLNFKEAYPLVNNACRTLGWVAFCYVLLFWLFGFCGGPLGVAIQNWMMASAADAGFVPSTALSVPEGMFEVQLRIFLGSIVALYATAPVAITAAVFLPCAKPRAIVLNADGLLFAQGPYLSLWGRQFRLWSDLKQVTVKKLKPKRHQPVRAKFQLAFRSGGRINFDTTQISAQDLRVLLDGIDEYAIACAVDPEVFEVCQTMLAATSEEVASDGKTHTSITTIAPQEFKSTIFVPHMTGEFLPGRGIRIIKQLASKPLCAVYLARDEAGRMVIVKQFYLAEDTEETRALAKILNREYELLSRLDHPGIAKVLDSFMVEQSTYLVIEHRVGSDLRAVVNEHGPRSEDLVIAWAKQLCEVMIYLHSREPAIIHRDLTPDNVIAGEDGQLRLIDFGAAREFLDGITGTMIGKHCYIPPEQLRGEATTKSDIYSFGGTLNFLLTGGDPVALSQSKPATSVDCSAELSKLIEYCTAFDQEDRPESFEQILVRLNEMDRGILVKILKAGREKEVIPA